MRFAPAWVSVFTWLESDTKAQNSLLEASKSLYTLLKNERIFTTCPSRGVSFLTPRVPVPVTEKMRGDPVTFHDVNSYGQLLWLLSRNLSVCRRKLTDTAFLRRECAWLMHEAELRDLLETQSYPAVRAMRQRLSALVETPLPRHAQETDVKSVLAARASPSCPRASEEINFWLDWRRLHGEHTSFGTVCLSVTCEHRNFCVSARKRGHDPDPGPGPDPGPSPPPPGPKRICRRRPGLTVACLPSDVWPKITEYACAWNDLPGLARLSRASSLFRAVVMRGPQAPLISHFYTRNRLRQLYRERVENRMRDGMLWQAPCSEAFDPFSRMLAEVVHTYTCYVNLYYELRYTLAQYSTDERQTLLADFIRVARRWTGAGEEGDKGDTSPDETRREKKRLTRILVDLDFRLLELFAFDVLTLNDECVHALPPRAFHRGSKHQRTYRRDFTEPAAYTEHRGARLLHRVHTLRDDMKQSRRTLYRALRAVEAFHVTHLQRLMDELSETGLVEVTPPHPCANLTSRCNSLLSFDVLQGFCDRLVLSAERSTATSPSTGDKYDVVRVVLDDLRRSVAERGCSNLIENLFRPSPSPSPSGAAPPTFTNWRLYMTKLLNANTNTPGRREPADPAVDGGGGARGVPRRRTVSIRIATRVNSEGKLSEGFSLSYEEFVGRRVAGSTGAAAALVREPSGPSTHTHTHLADLIAYTCLAVHALTPGRPGAPPRWKGSTTIASADVLLTWAPVSGTPHAGADAGAAPVVVFRETAPAALWDTFLATEQDVVQTLKDHGTITGRCAPCGRSLAPGNPWLGKTCVGHLPDAWKEQLCAQVVRCFAHVTE